MCACALRTHTLWFLTFPGQKKSRILWESTPAFSRTNAHYNPLQHHTPCAYVGYSTAVPLNLLNASFSARPETRRSVWSASEPICSRCLRGSAVDWLNASFESPLRGFKFKKTPGPFAFSPLTLSGELNVYFLAPVEREILPVADDVQRLCIKHLVEKKNFT